MTDVYLMRQKCTMINCFMMYLLLDMIITWSAGGMMKEFQKA